MAFERSAWQIFISSLVGKAGLALLLFMIVMSGYVLLTYPLDFGSKYWSNDKAWTDYPRAAAPEWWDIFDPRDLVTHRVLVTEKFDRIIEIFGFDARLYTLEFEHNEDGFPTDLILKYANLTFYGNTVSYIFMNVTRPDGREWLLINKQENLPQSQELTFPYKLYSTQPQIVLLGSDDYALYQLRNYLRSDFGINVSKSDIESIGGIKVIFGEPVVNNGSVDFKPLKGKYVFKIAIAGTERVEPEYVKVIVAGEVFGVLGTDTDRRDLYQGLLFGFPIALSIGVVTSFITTVIGSALGIVSGYKGGKVDEVIQRITDIVYNFPFLPLLIFIVFIVSRMPNFPRLLAIIAAIVALGWAGLTIIIRSMVLSLREGAFVEAAKAIGASDSRIMFRHIFPHLAPFIFAQMIFFTPGAILAEAALSFLGLGDPNIPSWGKIIEESFRGSALQLGLWWWFLPPGLLIMMAAVTFVLIALALEPIVNPKLQSR